MMSTTPRRSISQKVVKGAKSTAKAVTKPAAKGYRSLYAWTKRLTTGSSTKGKFATPVSERGLASPSTDRADFTPDEMSSPSEAPSSPAEESPTLAPLSYIKQIGGVGEEPMMAEEPATTVAAATAAEAEAAAEAVAPPAVVEVTAVKHGVPWRGSYFRLLKVDGLQKKVLTFDPESREETNCWPTVYKATGASLPLGTSKALVLQVPLWPEAPAWAQARVAFEAEAAEVDAVLAALARSGVEVAEE